MSKHDGSTYKYKYYTIVTSPVIREALMVFNLNDAVNSEIISYLDWANLNNIVAQPAISATVINILKSLVPTGSSFPFEKTVIYTVESTDSGLLVIIDYEPSLHLHSFKSFSATLTRVN